MKEYMIDLTGVKTKKQLHKLLKRELELPEYYGGNLDALYDCLSEFPEGTVIRVTGTDEARAKLGGYVDTLLRVISDAGVGES